MGIAVPFWPFGGKGPGADADTDADVADIAESGAAPSLQMRLHAWWTGSAVKAVADSAPDFEDGKVSLSKRLHAWWEGYDLSAEPGSAEENPAQADATDGNEAAAAADAADAGEPIDLIPPDPENVWSKERIELVQLLWGEGHIWPGGKEYIEELVNGLPLDPKVSMLELGAGLGAASRAVVETFGTYITALDRNAELVKVGNDLNTVHDMDGKIDYKTFDPTNIMVKENYFHAALLRDTLVNIKQKEELLVDVIAALKPEGQIMMTDFLFDDDGDIEELKKWREAEPEPVYPWSLGAIKTVFSANDVVMRIADDEGEAYCKRVVAVWNEYIAKIRKNQVPREMIGVMLWEADLYARRLAAMECGALRYYRILGIKTS